MSHSLITSQQTGLSAQSEEGDGFFFLFFVFFFITVQSVVLANG